MLVWLLACPRPALQVPPLDPELAAPLPVDAAVHQGVLDNGLRWYVEPNGEPADRVVLRLVVRAGSVLEDPDQLGLAHFVEHMAFNGTTHYPGQSMVTWLGSIGAEFGPHVNAHTAFDETVYKLQIPSDDPATLDAAFTVLADWAGGLTFDPAEIEAERPVVLEEWRTRLGAQGRIDDATMPALFFGSPYAERRPIGTEESLRTFDPAAARRFYADWYRPDLMAVIAVGDVDPASIEARIREGFSALRNPQPERERVQFEIPEHRDPKFAIVADPEVTRTSVQVLAERDDIEQTTVGSYRDDLVTNVALGILNERLAERARAADSPLLGAGAGNTRLTPTEGADVVSAMAKPGAALAAYRELALQVRRAREQGFTAGELARSVARVGRQYENLLLEVDKTPSAEHAAELVRVFTNGESMPGTPFEVSLARKYLPTITLDDLSAWARAWMVTSRVITVIQPASDPAPSEADLVAVDAEVAAATLPPLPDDGAVEPLVPTPPTPGTVTATDPQYAESLGFTGWTLSNGVRVWFKATDFKADEVVFQAFSPGGASRVSDADAVTAGMMLGVAASSGLGALGPTEIEHWLAGKRLRVSPRLDEDTDGFGGFASPSDLEAALQVLYAQVTAPRFTAEGLALAQEQQRAAIRNRDANPQTRFFDAYHTLVWPDDPRRRPWTLEQVDAVTLDGAQRVYRDRFAAPDGLVFVFVGALPPDFERLVTTWLGGLPVGAPEAAVDRGKRPAPGHLEQVVRAGLDPQGKVRLEWRGALRDDSWERRNQLFALGDALEIELREKLREELGGTYGVGVSAVEEYFPTPWYTVRVEFGCDPARVDELVAAVEQVVAQVRERGPAPEVVAQVQEQKRRGRESDVRTNGFWSSAFTGALERGADPLAILAFDQRNDALSPAVLQAAAAEWLVDAQRVRLVLLPAAPPATP